MAQSYKAAAYVGRKIVSGLGLVAGAQPCKLGFGAYFVERKALVIVGLADNSNAETPIKKGHPSGSLSISCYHPGA
jgi:hypothetical protein